MQLLASMKRLNLAKLSQAPIFLGLAFAFLIVVIVVSIALMNQAQNLRDRIDAEVQTQAKADRLLTLLRRMESGQRGYLLAGDADFLISYNEAAPLLPGVIDSLGKDIANNGRQGKLWAELQPLIRDKMTEMAESIRLYNAGKRKDANTLVRGAAGLRYMADIHDRIQALKDIEEQELQQHYVSARQQEWVLLSVNIVAVSLIIGVALISILIVRRANAATLKAQDVLRDANIDLEANVAARMAELKAANEEIQKFAYIVSHDLRSPLVNIMGFTSELETLKGELFERLATLRSPLKNGGAASLAGNMPSEDKAMSDDFDEALSFIKASITKMDRLINAVLTISREGNRTLRPEEIDMTALLTTMSQAMAHQAQAVDASLDIDPLPQLYSDRLALEQIFSNLLDNALKYLRPDTEGHIWVKGRAEGNRVVIEVADNGRGIEPRDQERIFELFRRAGAQDRPGEGMGLAHVRALVRRLGGVITLKSTPDEGSRFIVTLPNMQQQTQKRMPA
jgi:signal transduction histidine kinase